MVELKTPQLDTVFHALGDATRRRMLRELAGGERTVGQLAKPFAMSLAAASKHIRALEKAGLIESRWETAETGRNRKYYRVTEAGREQLAEERRQWKTVDDALRNIWSGTAEFARTDGAPVYVPQQG